ncbi:hypothetical protein [Kaarinaea lacus]
MNKISKYFFLLLVVSISACNNSSSGSSEEEQLKAIQDQSKSYFLYKSDQSSINAIDIDDPLNPVVIEPANSTMAGVTAASTAIPFGSNLSKRYVVNDTLVYAKDGRLWIIENISQGNFTPRQLSSEENSYNLCYATLNALEIDKSMHSYSYVLSGIDNDCYTGNYYQDPGNNNVWLPELSDNVRKWVMLNANSTTEPVESFDTISWIHPDSILFKQFDLTLRNFTITGLLALDDTGTLVWFEGTDFSAPARIVANNVTSMSLIAFGETDWAYLVVNGNLVSYRAGDSSLSASYYSLPSNYFDWRTYGESRRGYFYATVGQNLLRVNTLTPEAPTQISTHPYFETVVNSFKETDSHLYLEVRLSNQMQAISFNKSNGNIVELFKYNFSPETFSNYQRHVIGGNIYYSDEVTLATTVVDENGAVINTFPNTFIFSTMQSAVRVPDKDSRTHLLLAEHGSGPLTKIYVLDTTRNIITNLLGAITHVGYPTNGIYTHYNGRTVFALFDGGTQYNLFFADLFLENSITQITDSSTDDRPISFTLPPLPPPPGAPPPVPPPPAPVEPPPPPPPPPTPPEMGGGGGGTPLPPPPAP